MDAHSVDALLVSDFINYVMHIEAWIKAEKKRAEQGQGLANKLFSRHHPRKEAMNA